jgi:hypothetical protein
MKNEWLRSGKDQGSPALTSDEKTTAAVARLLTVAMVPVTSGEGEGDDEMQEGTAKSMAWSNLSFASWVDGKWRTEELRGGRRLRHGLRRRFATGENEGKG